MLSLRQLQYLVALADHQNFRRAAARLHVSQPTLSLQLQKLEELLGVRLVERGQGPVHLTPVGREITLRARKVLADARDLVAAAGRAAGAFAGTIALGVTPTLGPYLLPGVVGALKESMPDLRLHIREGIPSEQLLELRSGTIDLLLLSIAEAGTDLQVEPLFEEQLFLVAPPEHPLARKGALGRDDLLGSQLLTIDPRYPFHHQTRRICDELSLELLNNYEGTSLDSLCQMCASGLGLAVLPELYLRSEVGGKNVVVPLSITDWSASRVIAAVHRQNSVFGDMFDAVARAVCDEAANLLRN